MKKLVPLLILQFLVLNILLGFDFGDEPVSLSQAVSEGVTDVHHFDSVEGEIFWISGGEDRDLFQIGRSDGKLYFLQAPNFESPRDEDQDNQYLLQVTVDDDFISTIYEVTVSVTDLQESPKFNESSFTIRENQTASLQVGAVDEDGNALVHQLRGADAELFTIDEALGTITPVATADFENPNDANNDGTYELTIVASDGSEQITQDITIVIKDENELYEEFKLSSLNYTFTLQPDTVFSRVIIVDPDEGSAYTFEQLNSETSFVDLSSDGSISVNQRFVQEQPEMIELQVRATDEHGEAFEQIFYLKTLSEKDEGPDFGQDEGKPTTWGKIIEMDAGESHSLFIDEDGYLWGFGNNEFGQLAQGTTKYLNDPVCIDGPGINKVAAGRYHTLYTKLREDGVNYDLWGMGCNYFGQLHGGEKDTEVLTKKRIWPGNHGSVHLIAAGDLHSAFTYGKNHKLITMGLNKFGQCGTLFKNDFESKLRKQRKAPDKDLSVIREFYHPFIGNKYNLEEGNREKRGNEVQNVKALICTDHRTLFVTGGKFYFTGLEYLRTNGFLTALNQGYNSDSNSYDTGVYDFKDSVLYQSTGQPVPVGVMQHFSDWKTAWYGNFNNPRKAKIENVRAALSEGVVSKGIYGGKGPIFSFEITLPDDLEENEMVDTSEARGRPILITFDSYRFITNTVYHEGEKDPNSGGYRTPPNPAKHGFIVRDNPSGLPLEKMLFYGHDGSLDSQSYGQRAGLHLSERVHANLLTDFGNLTSKDGKTRNIESVVYGDSHVLVLTKDKKLYGRGMNLYGQLGSWGPDLQEHDFSKIDYALIKDKFSEGKKWRLLDKDVVLVAAGHFHSLWVKKDGTLKKLGANVTSQNKAYAKKIINKIEFDKEFKDYVLPLGLNEPVLPGLKKPLNVEDYFLDQNDLSGAETLAKDSLVGSTDSAFYIGERHQSLKKFWKGKNSVKAGMNTELIKIWEKNYNSFNENGKIPYFGIIGINQDTEKLYYKLGPIEKISWPYSPLAPVGRVLYSNEGEDPVDIWRVKGRGIERNEYNENSTSLTWTLKDKHYAPGFSYGYQLQTIRETKKHDYEIKVVLPTLKFTELDDYVEITDNEDDKDFIKKGGTVYRVNFTTVENSQGKIGNIPLGNSGGNEVKWELSSSGNKYFNLNDKGELSFKKQGVNGKYGPRISEDYTQQFLVYSAEAGGRKTNSQIRLRVYVKIQNINDPLKPPTFPKTKFEVLENRASVGNLGAVSPEGHRLKYYLVQDEYKRFALSEDGELRFQEGKEPDYEKTNEREFQIQVRADVEKSGYPSSYTVKNIRVKILDDTNEPVVPRWKVQDVYTTDENNFNVLGKNLLALVRDAAHSDLEFEIIGGRDGSRFTFYKDKSGYPYLILPIGNIPNYERPDERDFEVEVRVKSKSSGEFADHLFKIKISDIADEQINFLLNEKPMGLWHEIAQPITASWKPPTIQVQGAGQVTYEISGPDKDSIELNPVGWANSRNISRIDFTHSLVGEIDAMGGRMPKDANSDYVYEFSITARTNNTDGTENLEKTVDFKITLTSDPNYQLKEIMFEDEAFNIQNNQLVVGSVKASTKDSLPITYSIIETDDFNSEEGIGIGIDETSGVLTLDEGFDFDRYMLGSIKIQAKATRDGKEIKAEKTFNISYQNPVYFYINGKPVGSDSVVVFEKVDLSSSSIQFMQEDERWLSVTARTGGGAGDFDYFFAESDGTNFMGFGNSETIFKFQKDNPDTLLFPTTFAHDRFLLNLNQNGGGLEKAEITATSDRGAGILRIYWVPENYDLSDWNGGNINEIRDGLENADAWSDFPYPEDEYKESFEYSDENDYSEELLFAEDNGLNLGADFETADTLFAIENQKFVSPIIARYPDGEMVQKMSIDESFGDGDKFNLSEDGVLRFKNNPNYEKKLGKYGNSYSIKIRAHGANGLSEQTFAVAVQNMRSEIKFEPQNFETYENNESFEISLSASHRGGESLRFYFSNGNMQESGEKNREDSSNFTIDSYSGLIKFKNLPDFETPQDYNKDNEYVLSVRAESTQGGEPTTTQIKVKVLNKVSEKLEILIPEIQRLTTPEGSDYALGFDLNETFSKSIPLVVELSGPDASHFRSMEGKLFYWNQKAGAYLTGESEFFGLQFTNPPNYEYPMDAERDNTYRVIVKISSFNGDFTDTIYLTVTVTDVAEAPLILQPVAGSHYVREGTRFALPFSARPQGKGLPTYSLGGEHAALFELEAEKGRILFVNTPDFESVPRELLSLGYDLRIIAEANGVENARDVRVLISDVNEGPTGFSLSSNSVPEDSSSGTAVGNFRSFDPEGGALSYTLEPANSANHNQYFSLNGDELILASSLSKGTYVVHARVTDDTGKYQIQRFLIEATNLDRPPANISLSNLSLAENQPAGTLVGILSATDPDGDEVRFSLPDAPVLIYENIAFKIDGDRLLSVAPMDHEPEEPLDVLIRATDSTGLLSEKAFQITISDVDESPVWTESYSFEVSENAGPNVSVGTVTAKDPEGESISYSIEGSGTGFTMNGNQVVAVSSLDRENKDFYELVVIANDGTMEASTTVLVSVLDVDEPPTSLDINNGSISSNAPLGSVVGVVSAQDPEEGILQYEAYNPSGRELPFPFAMEGNQLVVNGFLSGDSIEVRLEASDSAGNSVVSDFGITIIQATEPPQLSGGSTHSVNEGTSDPVQLTSSYDGTGKVFYFLLQGEDSNVFSLDPSTGELNFNEVPDYEKPLDSDGDNSYEITIRLEADGLSSSYDRSILVSDVFEPPLPFSDTEVGANIYFRKSGASLNWSDPTDGSYSLTLNDSSRSLYYGGHAVESAEVDFDFFDLDGTEVLDGHFTKYGTDRSWEAAYRSFTMDLGLCKITDSSIEFSWVNPPAGESAYKLILRDPSGNELISGNHASGSASYDFVTGNIAPGTQLTGIFGLVQNGGALGSFETVSQSVDSSSLFYVTVPGYGTFTDVSENQSAVGTYSSVISISSEKDGDLFTFNASEEKISFVASPDFENPNDANADNTYELILNKSGGTKQFLAVSVLDVDESIILPSNLNESLSIALAEGSLGTHPLNLDLKDPEGREIQLTVTGGADAGEISFDTENMILFFENNSPDFENPTDANSDNTYEIELSASDGNNAVSMTANIRVLDLPDGKSVNLNLSDAVGGTSTGSGSFDEGDTVTITATAEQGYTFLQWEGERSSSENPYTFRIYNDTTLQPVFEEVVIDLNRELPFQLLDYEGDFTDSDGDGMTDVAEIKYGYDPDNYASFPAIDFIAQPVTEIPIPESTHNDAKILQHESGIRIKWDNNQSETSYSRYSLTLENGSEQLYYGGHGWDYAEVFYSDFQLQGTEVLRGRFSEYNPENGSFIRYSEWFEIDLSEYPLPPEDNDLAEDDDKISFRFNNFTDDEKNRYISFMRRVLPIIRDIMGNPAETFVCTFNKDNYSQNSWVTLEQGRSISMDDAWIPRLLVHEMIHMWKGKYAFSYSADNWAYADDLNGFEESAEGLAYEVLHDYIESYPYDENTRLILDNGAWWNWSPGSANFDIIKHQKHTGAGTFWSGEALFQKDRYSIAAMVIQTILRHDPDFMKKTLRAYYDKIEDDSNYRPTREGLLDLWSSQISKINNIDSRTYLEALPIFNGQKLEQGYYPVIFQNEAYSYGTTKTVFGSYAVDGNLWWGWMTPENLPDFNVPDWVNYNLDADGFYYIDSNNQPFKVVTRNIFGDQVSEFTDVLDTGYQNEEETVPNNLFTGRIEELDSSRLPQGLYVEELSFTDLASHTDRHREIFYSFGYDNFSHNQGEYSLFIGVDSMFAEDLTVSLNDKSFDLKIINGCAVLKTNKIADNEEGLLTITVNSFEESFTYSRALINSGSQDIARHQQFLIIDRDFDGIEDLYDSEVDETSIEIAYQDYKARNPGHGKGGNFFTVEINGNIGGSIETIGFNSGDSVKEGTNITIRAIPDATYEFKGWTGDLSSSSLEASITVSKDTLISGVFEESTNYFALDISAQEGGTIEGMEELLGQKVEKGTSVSLQASAYEGYEFTGWTTSLGNFPKSQNPLSITINENTTIQANFSQPELLPTISKVDGGINLTFEPQFSLTLKHVDDYLFYGGHAEGSALVDYQAFNLTGTENLRGRFTEYDSLTGEFVREYAWFEIKLTDYPPEDSIYYHIDYVMSEGGDILDNETQMYLSGMNSAVFSGTTITVDAIAYEGYEFTGWTTSLGNFPKSQNPLSITINENTTIQAIFSQPELVPTISKVDGGINLTFEPQYSLTLKHDNDYLFYGGHAEGSALVDYQAFNLTGTENLRGRFTEYDSLTGEFIKEYAWFEIKLTDYPPEDSIYYDIDYVMSEGGDILDHETQMFLSGMNSAVFSDTTITVNAIAYEGYEFTGWSTSLGDFPKSQNPLSITINENTTIQAIFSQPELLPTISKVDEGINLTFEPQYTLTLKHIDDYLFYGGHSEGSALVDYQAFNLTGTENLRGRFTEYNSLGEFVREYAWFEIKLTDYPPEGLVYYHIDYVMSEGGDILDYETQMFLSGMNSAVFSDATITVNAIAYEGYEFTGWTTSQGDFPKSDNPLSIIINENTTIQAKFSQPEFLPSVNSQSNGILLSWENFAWSQFSLTLMSNDDYLFYGGHGENSAMVDYQAFDLAGTETLRGRFTEYDSQTGEFIKEYAWFEIDLVSYRTNKIETTDLGDGWKNSNWLGVMFPVSNGWSFHMQLGWIFPDIQSENNVWIYDDVFGWYWTGAEFFPFIFIEDAQVWYFLDMDSTQINLRKYYDYNIEDWIQLTTGQL